MDDGVRHRGPNTEPTVNATPKIANRFDNNKYNTRKTLAKGLLDVALLSSNINNLKRLLRDQGTDAQHPLFEWVMGGLLLSVCLQVLIAFILLFIGNKDVNKEEDQDSAMQWNDILTGFVLVQTIVNVTVTQFMDF